ncbi:glycosyl transferase [Virgibacillus dokdonensis]|uniref:Glycosyl transferase n=1 Tax=Virgibacillus dokdonensis TaxID=302167 RepID=A0A3E0WL78_9BACI|nr:TIGR04540 family protein [Virgibacillus dokdonensis]RFA32736.1 glycosyl transferase [Virgibacillus dokdonensis]
MQVKFFYKTQRELAITLNSIIDSYWDSIIDEDTLISNIETIYVNNRTKIVKEDKFTTILKQQCGKRRLEVVERIINMRETDDNKA